ncbi:MAG: septum formation protein Maf [Rhodospirillaceae bacterium]|nr:MAG: septum formation protein Maf [Rhodospirillaceae bacterium]
MNKSKPEVVLASKSQIRAQLLRNAGLAFACEPAPVDEGEIKHSMQGEPIEAVAQVLAEMKAQHVSRKFPDALVIGADQILECDGVRYDKPADLTQARKQLATLRGRSHDLVSVAMVVRGGARLWHHVDRVHLEMRPFSDAFLDAYLASIGEDALMSVGSYQLEGRGAQLFSRVRGDYFAILGLPLLPLLGFLREQGALAR